MAYLDYFDRVTMTPLRTMPDGDLEPEPGVEIPPDAEARE